MENLKRRQTEGSILLEALIALAVFAVIASLLLTQISHSRKEQARLLQEEEILRAARMAMQTGQSELDINGVSIRQVKGEEELILYQKDEELIRVQKN